MDTLKAVRTLETAGLPKTQAEAISRIINDLGRADLVTKNHLDIRLLQHTVAIIASAALIVRLFNLFA